MKKDFTNVRPGRTTNFTNVVISEIRGPDAKSRGISEILIHSFSYMLSKRIKIFFLFLVPCSLFLVSAVSAGPEIVNLPNPLGAHDIPTLLGRIIKGFLGITGSIALIMFVYGGITWLTSAGNADKIKKGKDIFLWSVVGLFIIFGSYLMVDFVISGITGQSVGESVKCCIVNTTKGYQCKAVTSVSECKDGNPSPVTCGQEKPKVCP